MVILIKSSHYWIKVLILVMRSTGERTGSVSVVESGMRDLLPYILPVPMVIWRWLKLFYGEEPVLVEVITDISWLPSIMHALRATSKLWNTWSLRPSVMLVSVSTIYHIVINSVGVRATKQHTLYTTFHTTSCTVMVCHQRCLDSQVVTSFTWL